MAGEPKARAREPRALTVIGMVLSGLALLVGIAMLIAGIAAVGVDAFGRDDDGFLTSPAEDFQSQGFAVTAERIDLSTGPADWAPEDVLGTTRVTAEGLTGDALFVGIARSDDVDAYLSGVAHSEVEGFTENEVDYTDHLGRLRPADPAREDFWVAQSSGSGPQTVEWDAESGVWSVVVMNESARPGVAFEAKAGVELDWLAEAGVILLVVGFLVTVSGGLASFFLIRYGLPRSGAAKSAPTE